MRAFLDSSTIIYALEFAGSNSAAVYDAALEGRFAGVINDQVVDEVRRYLRRRAGRDAAYLAAGQLVRAFEVVPLASLSADMDRLRGTIHRKDLAHLATVRALTLPRLVALDDDFRGAPEYRTPRQFARELGLARKRTEY